MNTLYDSVVVLSPDEVLQFLSVSQRNSITPFDLELEKLGILTGNLMKEKTLLQLLQNELYNHRNGVPSVTILPTQTCNARCEYCFAEHNAKHTMDKDTADKVVSLLSDYFASGDRVLLRWFGGEPLLSKDIISSIIKGINVAFDGKLQYESIIFTNGSLITDSVIEDAIHLWRVKKIQLTIDGYGEEHNRRKNYKDSSLNHYSKVILNTKKLLSAGIAVDCRINLDKDNINQLDLILDDLVQYKDDPLFRVRVTVLRPSDCGFNQFRYITPNDLSWAYDIIYRLLFGYGFITDICAILPRRMRELCIAKSIDKIIIGSDGVLYKCLQQVFSPNQAIGSLETGIRPVALIDRSCELAVRSDCSNCVFLPQCMGGCDAYRQLQNSVPVTPCIREKFFYDLLLEYTHNWAISKRIIVAEK